MKSLQSSRVQKLKLKLIYRVQNLKMKLVISMKLKPKLAKNRN